MEKQAIGICYECSTKNNDSSEKPVYHCDDCGKWFCELHKKPKFPYFVDWETQFDVQGNPAVKAFFYSEYKRGDGHPDFIHLRKYIETLELEEKKRNKLIEQALERMTEADEKRSYEKWMKDAEKKALQAAERAKEKVAEEAEEANLKAQGKARTQHGFIVPYEVYLNPTYREYLDYAKNERSIKVIVDEFNEKYRPKLEATKQKKRHWWQ